EQEEENGERQRHARYSRDPPTEPARERASGRSTAEPVEPQPHEAACCEWRDEPEPEQDIGRERCSVSTADARTRRRLTLACPRRRHWLTLDHREDGVHSLGG